MRTITRRDFGRTLGAGAALATLGAPLRNAAAEVAPNDRIRLGVVGYGSRGRGNLAEFLRNPEVECVAVCEVDQKPLAAAVQHVQQQRGNTPDAVTDYRRVVDRDDIDAVLVSTPDHWHALPTIHACQNGKDVYVEKPFARTIDEGRAILEAARRHGRVVQMGTQWRSGAHYAEAIAFLHTGALGPIRSVRAWSYKDWDITPQEDGPAPEGVDYDLWLGPSPARPFNANRFHRNFRWYWDYAGGLMTDLGVHVLNLCQWGTGLEHPTRISSMGGMRVLGDTGIETPDTQTAIYEFPTYTLTWEHQLRGRLAPKDSTEGAWFSGTRGALWISSGGWQVVPDPVQPGLEAEVHPTSEDGRAAHVRNFLDCMRSREQPVSGAETAHHVTTLGHLGNIALRAGTDILWDPEAERITNNPDADAQIAADYRSPYTLPYARRA